MRHWLRKTLQNEIVRAGSGSSVLGDIPYEKNDLAALRRQITIDLSENVFISSRNVPDRIEHSVAALYGRNTEIRAQERVMSSTKKGAR